MDIQKIYAKNSREGIAKVKQLLGDNAIILATRKHVKGVEIIATPDSNSSKLEPFFDQRQSPDLSTINVSQLAESATKAFTSPVSHQAQALSNHHKTSRVEPKLNDLKHENKIDKENQLALLQQEHALNDLKSGLSGIKQLLDTQNFNSQVMHDHSKQTDRQIVALRKELKFMQGHIQSQAKNNVKAQMPIVSSLRKEIRQLRKTVAQQQKPVISRVHSEISVLKDSLQNQFDVAGWSRWSETNPVRASMLGKLTKVGLKESISQKILTSLEENEDKKLAWRQVLGIWAKEIHVTHDNIIRDGGRIALVGPTGVGKTTTIAKLASKFITRHGESSVALISYDHYRVGAHDQLMTYGRLIGVPVITAMHRNELNDILATLNHKKLVLIDTAGMSPNNPGFKEHIDDLRNQSVDNELEHYLTLSANTQYSALKQIIENYSALNIKASILTKTDEATNFGEVISAIVERQMPVAYVTTGQTVPSDIEEAKVTDLISKSISLASEEKRPVSTASMAQTYGPLVANL